MEKKIGGGTADLYRMNKINKKGDERDREG